MSFRAFTTLGTRNARYIDFNTQRVRDSSMKRLIDGMAGNRFWGAVPLATTRQRELRGDTAKHNPICLGRPGGRSI